VTLLPEEERQGQRFEENPYLNQLAGNLLNISRPAERQGRRYCQRKSVKDNASKKIPI
jgi:hypothetical protein